MSAEPPEILGCIWCWRQPARVQDTGHRMCQPCWSIYITYVADEVEPPDSPFRQLIARVREIVTPTTPLQGEPDDPDQAPF